MFKRNFIPDDTIAHASKEFKVEDHTSGSHRPLIYGACAGGALLLIIIIVIIVAASHQPIINDDFFISDDTKTTIDISSTGGDSTSDHQTRTVYEYDGNDNVISMKTYFEYSDADAAATAYASLKDQFEFKSSTLQGKYIIVTADESQFKGLTASDIRQQAEAIRAYQAQQNSSSSEDN